MARIDDTRGSVQARIVNILGGGDDVLAETDVRSVLQGGSDGPARPGMFKADEPVNVTAAKLERKAKKAVYTGDAQIWQGATSIKGDTITLDEDTGNLLAVGQGPHRDGTRGAGRRDRQDAAQRDDGHGRASSSTRTRSARRSCATRRGS